MAPKKGAAMKKKAAGGSKKKTVMKKAAKTAKKPAKKKKAKPAKNGKRLSVFPVDSKHHVTKQHEFKNCVFQVFCTQSSPWDKWIEVANDELGVFTSKKLANEAILKHLALWPKEFGSLIKVIRKDFGPYLFTDKESGSLYLKHGSHHIEVNKHGLLSVMTNEDGHKFGGVEFDYHVVPIKLNVLTW